MHFCNEQFKVIAALLGKHEGIKVVVWKYSFPPFCCYCRLTCMKGHLISVSKIQSTCGERQRAALASDPF